MTQNPFIQHLHSREPAWPVAFPASRQTAGVARHLRAAWRELARRHARLQRRLQQQPTWPILQAWWRAHLDIQNFNSLLIAYEGAGAIWATAKGLRARASQALDCGTAKVGALAVQLAQTSPPTTEGDRALLANLVSRTRSATLHNLPIGQTWAVLSRREWPRGRTMSEGARRLVIGTLRVAESALPARVAPGHPILDKLRVCDDERLRYSAWKTDVFGAPSLAALDRQARDLQAAAEASGYASSLMAYAIGTQALPHFDPMHTHAKVQALLEEIAPSAWRELQHLCRLRGVPLVRGTSRPAIWNAERAATASSPNAWPNAGVAPQRVLKAILCRLAATIGWTNVCIAPNGPHAWQVDGTWSDTGSPWSLRVRLPATLDDANIGAFCVNQALHSGIDRSEIVQPVQTNGKLDSAQVNALCHEMGHVAHLMAMNRVGGDTENARMSDDLVEIPAILLEDMAYDDDFRAELVGRRRVAQYNRMSGGRAWYTFTNLISIWLRGVLHGAQPGLSPSQAIAMVQDRLGWWPGRDGERMLRSMSRAATPDGIQSLYLVNAALVRLLIRRGESRVQAYGRLLPMFQQMDRARGHDRLFRQATGRSLADLQRGAWRLLRRDYGMPVDHIQMLGHMARNGRLDLLDLLITRGANLHAEGEMALRLAARHGHEVMVQRLLALGCDPHAERDAALVAAARYGHLDVVRLLLRHGAHLHARDHAALRWTVRNGHIDLAVALLAGGADAAAAAQWPRGWTRAHRADGQRGLDVAQAQWHAMQARGLAVVATTPRGSNNVVDCLAHVA